MSGSSGRASIPKMARRKASKASDRAGMLVIPVDMPRFVAPDGVDSGQAGPKMASGREVPAWHATARCDWVQWPARIGVR
jgi:hypothetical protein